MDLACFLINKRLQLTFKQHGSELCGSTYTQIVFNKYSTCIFILQIFKISVGNSVLDYGSQYVELKELEFES